MEPAITGFCAEQGCNGQRATETVTIGKPERPTPAIGDARGSTAHPARTPYPWGRVPEVAGSNPAGSTTRIFCVQRFCGIGYEVVATSESLGVRET